MEDTNDLPSRAAPVAADGTPIKVGARVHLVGRVIGAAGPINDLHDTGVVAVEVEGYDNGHAFTTPYHKLCVAPGAVAHEVLPDAVISAPADPGPGDPNEGRTPD